MKSTDKGKGCIAIEGDREKDGVKEESERNVRPRAGFLRSENPLHRLSSLFLAEIETSTAISCIPLFIGPSLMYSHGLDYRFNIPPFPLSAPLDVLPFTTTSFPPMCSNPSSGCCLSAYLPIDPKGSSSKASRPARLCMSTYLTLARLTYQA